MLLEVHYRVQATAAHLCLQRVKGEDELAGYNLNRPRIGHPSMYVQCGPLHGGRGRDHCQELRYGMGGRRLLRIELAVLVHCFVLQWMILLQGRALIRLKKFTGESNHFYLSAYRFRG